MTNLLADYQLAREQLLARITEGLRQDSRFVAAWLTGSYGRGDQDAVSDLDLNVVVADAFAHELCHHPTMISVSVPQPRLALISQFGQPVILHENHFNAPTNGSFTYALYADTAVQIDWILIPQSHATRPPTYQLLFDHVGIAAQTPDALDEVERCDLLSEKRAFFWMMLAITAKYIARQDAVKVQDFLDTLHHLLDDIEQLLSGTLLAYRRGSLMTLQPTRDAQIATCHALMQRMQALTPQIIALGVDLTPAPATTIEHLLALR